VEDRFGSGPSPSPSATRGPHAAADGKILKLVGEESRRHVILGEVVSSIGTAGP
jgi:hypothetical protein